jgi:phospholipase/carboxylesterase
MDSTPAPLLETVEHETGPSPAWSVLWLHGLGADGHDFAPIVPELCMRDGSRRGWPALRFVFPHAPVRPVTVNNGMRMRAWYDIRNFGADELGGGDRADSAGVLESVMQVEALVAREAERGIAPERIVLAGFSQGCAMALLAGLRHGTRLAGIAGLSGYLPLARSTAAERSAANRDTPIFLALGTMDDIVQPQRGEASRDALQALGYYVEWHSYPMGHSVCIEEIADLNAWLLKTLR